MTRIFMAKQKSWEELDIFFLLVIIVVVIDERTQGRQFSFKNPLLFIKYHFIVLLQNIEELKSIDWVSSLFFPMSGILEMSSMFYEPEISVIVFILLIFFFLPIFTPFLWQVL